MAAFSVADHVRSAGRQEFSVLTTARHRAASPARPMDAGPLLVACWTVGADRRLDLHWDVDIPPGFPG